MTMVQLPGGAPKIGRARKQHECAAFPCRVGQPIADGELNVYVHDANPQSDARGRTRTDLRYQHFSVHYHLVCFRHSHTVDSRTSILSYELPDLAGYDRHRDEVERVLAAWEAQQSR